MNKKTIAIIVVLVLVVIFAISWIYKNNEIKDTVETISQTTTKELDTELSDDDILLENEESGYVLYYKNDNAILVNKNENVSMEFPAWTPSIELEKPEMYYADFDHCGEKDLLISLATSAVDLGGEKIINHTLYLFKIKEVDGEKTLAYIIANNDNWRSTYTNAIRFDARQLTDKNYLQIALNDKSEDLNFDEATGFTDNKYTYYAKIDGNGSQPYTLITCSFGLGLYTVEGDTITVDIQVLNQYAEADGQYLMGHIHSEMMFYENRLRVKPRTIRFIPLDEKAIDDPRPADMIDTDNE